MLEQLPNNDVKRSECCRPAAALGGQLTGLLLDCNSKGFAHLELS